LVLSKRQAALHYGNLIVTNHRFPFSGSTWSIFLLWFRLRLLVVGQTESDPAVDTRNCRAVKLSVIASIL